MLHFKEQALDAIVPFFKLAQNFTILLLVIYIAIYVCIVIFLKKGGGSYNKSIVFGDGGSDLERGMDDKPI